MASDSPPASWLSRIFGGKSEPAPPSGDGKKPGAPASETEDGQTQPDQENKKGLFKRIFGIFGGNKKDADKQNQGTQDPAH
jgi:hypothetical protein